MTESTAGPWATTRKGLPMVRVTLQMDGQRRTIWAAKRPETKSGRVMYVVLTKEGDDHRSTKKVDELREVVLADPKDIVEEKPARLNLKYGEMELVDES